MTLTTMAFYMALTSMAFSETLTTMTLAFAGRQSRWGNAILPQSRGLSSAWSGEWRNACRSHIGRGRAREGRLWRYYWS